MRCCHLRHLPFDVGVLRTSWKWQFTLTLADLLSLSRTSFWSSFFFTKTTCCRRTFQPWRRRTKLLSDRRRRRQNKLNEQYYMSGTSHQHMCVMESTQDWYSVQIHKAATIMKLLHEHITTFWNHLNHQCILWWISYLGLWLWFYCTDVLIDSSFSNL